MGCLRLTYNEQQSPLRVVHRKSDPAQKVVQRFIRVDRFSSKYPAQSPYVYAANNPMTFIDVNGDSLDIPNNRYKEQTLKDLATIYSTPMGRKIINKLSSSKKTYTIDGGKWFSNNYNVLNREVNYKQKTVDADGVESPSFVVLAHELFHAYDHNEKGTWDHITSGKRSGESRAVRFGNYIREIYGKGFRENYSGLGKVASYDRRYRTNGLRLHDSKVGLGENTILGDRIITSRLRYLDVLYDGKPISKPRK